MLKKIVISIVIFLISWIAYENLLIPFFSHFKDKKFKTYPFLHKGISESQNYKITKFEITYDENTKLKIAFKLKFKFSIQYDSLTSNYFITSDKFIWKIDKFGNLIDSLEASIGEYMNNSGIIFNESYYIDWAISGDKSKKEYVKIINYDTLSDSDFTSYLVKAESTHIYTGNFITRCYLKIDNELIQITSDKLHDDAFEKVYYKWKIKHLDESKTQRFKYHQMRTAEIHSSKYGSVPTEDVFENNSILELQHFAKTHRTRRGMAIPGAPINNSKSGWEGIGYFEWDYNHDKLHFKADVFDHFDSYSLEYKIITSSMEEQRKDGLVFIMYDHHNFESLYIVSPKRIE